MLIAPGLPQLCGGVSAAGERMADELFSLNLHGLRVHVGKPLLDLRDCSAKAC